MRQSHSLLLSMLLLCAATMPGAAHGQAQAAASVAPAPAGHAALLPGVRLWYTDTGNAQAREVVVMLHPNTGTSEIWDEQAKRLAESGYRVIAFDRRGWGKSVPLTEADNGKASIAEDLENLVQYLKIERFHLLGIAGGGFAALDYAAWKPERIRSLIVGGSTGQLSDPGMKAVVERIEIPGSRNIPAYYREVGPSYRARDPQGVARWHEIEEHAMQKGAKSQPLHTPNTLAKIATINAPTLLIAGGADLLAPPSLMRMWATAIKDKEWALLPEAGHALNWEEPVLFNQAVSAFLKKH